MNIKSLTIKNFRNFEDFNINFSDGFQTIIGENNIGKSNLYWAMRLILDKDLSYNSRNLELKDFHGFRNRIAFDDYILISIELFSSALASFPSFHAIKTSMTTARLTYIFAHKLRLAPDIPRPDEINEEDFSWKLFGGGQEIQIDTIIKECPPLSFRDIDGINLYYINAFRNINADLHGSTKSLLSKYCQSRKNTLEELKSVKDILKDSSDNLNKLPFIPNITQSIQSKGTDIAGQYFSFPISISFLSIYDMDAWSQLNLFFSPSESPVPIQILGLGQKNILYLSLFIAELENSSNPHEINILLIEEPEAHLHPQLQKILFSNLNNLKATQVFMTSHSTHIASDCNYKNLNILFKNNIGQTKSFSPFAENLLTPRQQSMIKRYLDATRTELFFSSAIFFVEGVGEQFVLPAIAQRCYGINLTEHNISIIPIHCRYFEPYLKLVQNNNLAIPAVAIIDGDTIELEDEQVETTSVANAKKFEVEDRVLVASGTNTLESDLFPDQNTNHHHLKSCFENLGHKKSYENLIAVTNADPTCWREELIKRIDKVIKKGRFAQELSLVIDSEFTVPQYLHSSIIHIAKCKKITIANAK